MTIFDVLTLIGGVSLFLYGMSVMGKALEITAGGKLETTLGKLTNNKAAGLLTGLGVTAVIQSSGATTVMVVGFVNSGIMTLRQAIPVIMGSNIGTTVTAWLLSLTGISGENLLLQLLKPMSFTPILALIGICLQMFAKSKKKKDFGAIFLGFAVLMFGMDIVSGAVAPLKDIPAFRQLFIMFENPILGIIVGALVTTMMQSSSASVGILQAFASTGAITYGSTIPIIMGQNIGSCTTALLSSVGANKNARRVSMVHLLFNIIGTLIWVIVYYIVRWTIAPAILGQSATEFGIAIIHTMFNVSCVIILFPASKILEKLAYKFIPESETSENTVELDDRLLLTPAVAINQTYDLTLKMAELTRESLTLSIDCLTNYDAKKAEKIHEMEDLTDHYEDIIGTYLVKLSSKPLNEKEGTMASVLLKAIGDFERITDHAVNILESSEELREKDIKFTEMAVKEMTVLCQATLDIVNLSHDAFIKNDIEIANLVEPLEEIIDKMKKLLRANHITRLRQGMCGIEAGFVWSDLISNMERVSDHCSNIAGCVIDIAKNNMNMHESLKTMRGESQFYREKYKEYSAKYIDVLN